MGINTTEWPHVPEMASALSKQQIQSRNKIQPEWRGTKAMILNLWVVTLWGRSNDLSQGSPGKQIFTSWLITVARLQIQSSNKNNVTVEVTTAWRPVLKGSSVRKGKSCCIFFSSSNEHAPYLYCNSQWPELLCVHTFRDLTTLRISVFHLTIPR